MKLYYLTVNNDTLEYALPHATRKGAVDAFRDVAQHLRRFSEEPVRGWIHIARNWAELTQDADYFLELGPRGGVKVKKL